MHTYFVVQQCGAGIFIPIPNAERSKRISRVGIESRCMQDFIVQRKGGEFQTSPKMQAAWVRVRMRCAYCLAYGNEV